MRRKRCSSKHHMLRHYPASTICSHGPQDIKCYHSKQVMKTDTAFPGSNVPLQYLQIVYDIYPLVLAVLKVNLHSHRKLTPASSSQMKRGLSREKQKFYTFTYIYTLILKELFKETKQKLMSSQESVTFLHELLN